MGAERWEEGKPRCVSAGAADGRSGCEGREAALRAPFPLSNPVLQELHAISWMWFAPRAISTAVKFQQMNNVVFNKFHQAKERILTRSC